MSQWKLTDDAANSISYFAKTWSMGSGATAQAANNTAMFANVTPGAFLQNSTFGQFGVTKGEMANTSGERSKIQAAGWLTRRAFEGGVATVTGANGSGFANGETVKVSGGSSNATITVVANATGNLAGGTVAVGGAFTNSSGLTYTFNREKHLVGINVTGGSGYANTDTIRVSNAIVNAIATISTNSIGGFVNGGITITNVGLFAAAEANADVVIAVLAANGAATNGTTATVTANLATSTGGVMAVATLGGRAGRVTYETMVSTKYIANGAGSNSVYLPQ